MATGNSEADAGRAPARVVIIGGGISGLAAAYYLQRDAKAAGRILECTIVEGAGRLGGKVVTHARDGFVVEGGPDSFLTQKPWALELCRELGLADHLLPTNDASRKVYVAWNGKLHRLPEGVLLIVPTRLRPFALSPLFSPFGKLRMGLDLVIPARREASDESVAAFVRRRLGNEALYKIAEPLMGGIHVSDPETQSLLATFPRFADIEKKHGSMIRGILAGRRAHPPSAKPLPMFMTLRGGIEELTQALTGRLNGARVITRHRVASIARNGRYAVRLDDGASLEADAVVLANPAREAAALLEGLDGGLAERLRAIRYVSTANVSLGYRRETLGHRLDGFGVVVPSRERRRITACTWSSTKFDHRAPDGYALLRCFLGSPHDDAPARLPDDEMVRVAREELRHLMGVRAEPVLMQVNRWAEAHPQYDVGHLDLLSDIETRRASHPGLHITGSSYRGVGLPDCIHNAALTATSVLEGLGRAN